MPLDVHVVACLTSGCAAAADGLANSTYAGMVTNQVLSAVAYIHKHNTVELGSINHHNGQQKSS